MSTKGQDWKIAAYRPLLVCTGVILDYIERAVKISRHSLSFGDVPVGCVIVVDGTVIASAFNKREKTKNILDHAEVIAIVKAAKKLKTWNLNNAEMYTTLYPCSMCMEVIKASRIEKVYFLANKLENKKEYSKVKFEKIDNKELEEGYVKRLSGFFTSIRQGRERK